MAGRRPPRVNAVPQVQAPRVTDAQTQRALDTLYAAVLDLQRRAFGGGSSANLFTATTDGIVPASGGSSTDVLHADGTWGPCDCDCPPAALADGDYGDIVASGSGTALTIDARAVTFAKMQTIASQRFLARVTAGSGDIETITGTQATAMLDVYAGSSPGLVPTGAGSTTKYLREDGAWAEPTTTVTPVLSIAAETPGNFDFGVLGTYDWCHPEINTFASQQKQQWHSKRGSPGWLLNSFFWVSDGVTYTATDSRAWTLTAAGSDDVLKAGLSGTKAMPGQNGAVNGTGFRFALPCDPNQNRTVRWQGTMFNVNTTTTARLTDGSVVTQTKVVSTAASSGLDYRHAVTFRGAAGTWVVIDHVITGFPTGTTGNLYCGAIGAS